MAHIVIDQPGIPPMTVELASPETRLGRAEDNDVILVADEVSRYHATLKVDGPRTMLIDHKSMNGTYVNRQRILQHVVNDGDEIWLGSKCRAVFHDDAPEVRGQRKKVESSMRLEMDKIAKDMEDVTATMTMIGGRAPVVAPDVDSEKTRRAFRRLNAIYKATQLIASEFDLQKRMSDVLDLAIEETGADCGFLVLRNDDTDELEVRVAREMGQVSEGSPSMGVARRAAIEGEPVLLGGQQDISGLSGRESIIQQKITSAMCVPLEVDTHILGSLYVDTRKSGGQFTQEDLELFQAMANQSAMAIENVRLHEQMLEEEKRRTNLSRFLSPGIVEHLLTERDEIQLGGAKRDVTILFCDIRGFTPISEGLPPDRLVDLLNEHFTAMTDIIFEHHGTLDKYIGDEVMALFGAPFERGNDAVLAVQAAMHMQRKNAELNEHRAKVGLPPFELGIGVNTGEVFTGYVGSPRRLDFTVIGDHVNVASRLCSVARGGAVIIGESTYRAVSDMVEVRSAGTPVLKGKSEEVNAYEVLGFKNTEPATTAP